MPKKKEFTSYREEGVKSIVDDIKKSAWRKAYDVALRAVEEKLREAWVEFPTAAPILEEAQLITIRKRTVQSLLDGMKKSLQKQYGEALRLAGENVGVSFGHDLMRTLRSKQVAPSRYEALLLTWAAFDASANWGAIRFEGLDFERERFRIGFEHNFLADGYEEDIHRHCAFIEGYIKGVLNELFFEWIRLIPIIAFPPPVRLTCRSVTEIEGAECIFDVILGKESLLNSRDKLFNALEKYDEGDFNGTATLCRTATEYAFKEKVGFDIGQYRKFNQLLRIYETEGLLKSTETSEIKDVYFKASDAAHGGKTTKSESYKIFESVRKFIHKLEEEVEITQEKAKLVAKAIELEGKKKTQPNSAKGPSTG